MSGRGRTDRVDSSFGNRLLPHLSITPCQTMRLEPDALERVRLPRSFTIYSYCCGPHYPVEARCEALEGLWTTVETVTAKNATQRKEETRAAFKARLKWLGNAAV
jgi:hypothetical protein